MAHYLEDLRKDAMRSGKCALDGVSADPLEEHHESYNPVRTIFVCHDCHWKITFQPWLLTDAYKTKLLNTRYAGQKVITQDMIDAYVSPRRPVF